MFEISNIEFELLKKFLYTLSGIEVPDNKRYLFQTRLSAFLEERGCQGFSTLYHQMMNAKDKTLQEQFVQSMTTHESGFFRDTHPFVLLEKKLLPEIARTRIAEARFLAPSIRILSAGCSIGQEPYSIAISVKRWLKTQEELTEENVGIRGTDISESVVKRAKQGRYSELELGKSLPSEVKNRYFTKEGSHWLINNDIKKMVSFSELNLSGSFSGIGKFDIVFCRNVIIYFPVELKKKILTRFHGLLNPQGALIMGASEGIYNLSSEFKAATFQKATYYIPVK